MNVNELKPFRVGLSTNGKVIGEALFKEFQQAGIGDAEITTAYDKYADLDFHELRTWAQTNNVNLWSLHLPFSPFDIIDLSKRSLAKHTISYYSELIKKGTEIGIGVFVVHPSGEPIEESERADRMECAKESLAELAEIAAARGAVIAVEDLPRTCLGRNSTEILELIGVHPALRVCFDTNHLLAEDIPTFVRNVGKKIITLHVSDYDFINERHWLPGEGDICWPEVLDALREVDYTGPWLYEVGYKSPKTIVRRLLTADDFVQNANTLFAGDIPVAIGKRKPNLGMWG